MSSNFLKTTIFGPKFYTQLNNKQVLGYNKVNFRHKSTQKVYFPHILPKELILGYTPVQWWRKSLQRKTWDPENGDSNPEEEGNPRKTVV
jgi:hypothetical protein